MSSSYSYMSKSSLFTGEDVIGSKTDAYERIARGEFGNRLRTWDTRQELEDSGYRGEIGLRYMGGVAGRKFVTCRPYHEVDTLVADWLLSGLQLSDIIFCEAAPHAAHGRINAEVMRTEEYYTIRYSTLPVDMRASLANGSQYASGLRALLILQHYMDEMSLEQLNTIFDKHPSAIVEFSSFDCSLGIEGWNTVFWEVRHY